jgi:hypothetical protein
MRTRIGLMLALVTLAACSAPTAPSDPPPVLLDEAASDTTSRSPGPGVGGG